MLARPNPLQTDRLACDHVPGEKNMRIINIADDQRVVGRVSSRAPRDLGDRPAAWIPRCRPARVPADCTLRRPSTRLRSARRHLLLIHIMCSLI